MATKERGSQRRKPGKQTASGEARRQPALRQLRLMISSRNNDPFAGAPLSELRGELKQRLGAIEVVPGGGAPSWRPFDVWINEDEAPAPGSATAWERCMEAVDRADIVIALVNGRSGWSLTPGGVGICEAELQRALQTAPDRVRVIRLPDPPGKPAPRDVEFQRWLDGKALWMAKPEDVDGAIRACAEAATEALKDLCFRGSSAVRRGRYDSGEALEWSRLDYDRRAAEMTRAGARTLVGLQAKDLGGGLFRVPVDDVEIAVQLHAIPGPTGQPAARERIGQPFVRDARLDPSLLDGAVGPVHLVLCQRGMTETQATKILGSPDAITVATRAGIWAADEVSKAQLLFISNCRDPSTTRLGVQAAFDWLNASGEAQQLVRRARSRARIVTAIRSELEDAVRQPSRRRGG